MGIIIHVMYVDKSLAHGKLLASGNFTSIYVNNSIIIASASSDSA